MKLQQRTKFRLESTSVTSSLGRVVNVALVLATVSLFTILVSTNANIVARFVFDKPIGGVVELGKTLLIAIVFLVIASTQAGKRNVRVELLLNRLSPKRHAAADFIAYLVGLAIFTLITWCTGVEAYSSWQVGEYYFGAIPFPIWPAKVVICIGSALLCLQLSADLFGLIAGVLRLKATDLTTERKEI